MPGARKSKYPWPLSVIFNAKILYVFFIVIMIASMGAIGFGNFGSGSNNTTAPIVIDSTPAPTSDAQQWPEGPPPVIDGSTAHVATIETSEGDIVIALSTEAPEAVNSFAFLAAKNFYDGVAFFYVDQDYFTQSGDPTCTGEGDRTCSGLGGPGYSLPIEGLGEHEEFSVVLIADSEGGLDVHGSQFRILYTADERLDGTETVFGKVIEGQEILIGLSDLSVCSVSTAADCQDDLSTALIIEDVTIRPVDAAVLAEG